MYITSCIFLCITLYYILCMSMLIDLTFILADKICLSAYRSGSSLHIHTRKELQSVLYRVEQTFIHKRYFIVYLELLLVANKSIFHFTDIPSTCLWVSSKVNIQSSSMEWPLWLTVSHGNVGQSWLICHFGNFSLILILNLMRYQ